MFSIGGVNGPSDPRAPTANAAVGDFNVTLENTTGLTADGWVFFEMTSKDPATYALDLGTRTVDPTWTELKNGVKLAFALQIKSIAGNTITLKQPLPYPITASLPWTVSKYNYIEGFGVEDIAFVGNFKKAFFHHGTAEDDSGYGMLSIKEP